MHGAVRQHREGVVDVARPLGIAHERHDPLGLLRDVRQRLLARLQEVLLEQQVLGRIARQRELGEEDELGAAVARRRDAVAQQAGVALDVAHPHVDLGERDAERRKRAGSHAHILPARGGRAAAG